MLVYTLPSKLDAEEMLDALKKIIHNYGFTTVADAKELMDISDTTYVDNSIGWKNLDKAFVGGDFNKSLFLPEPEAHLESDPHHRPDVDPEFENFVYRTRADAMNDFEAILETLRLGGELTIGEVKHQASPTATIKAFDYLFGWKPGDLNEAKVIRTAKGYLLDLPAPKPLD